MTFEEARAAVSRCFERFAYLNAGTFGPLARGDGRRDGGAGRGASSSTAAAAGAYFDAMPRAARTGARGARGSCSRAPPENCRSTTSTTDGCNIVARRARPRPGRRDRDDRRRALRPARGRSRVSAARCASRAVRERPAAGGARRDRCAEVTPRTRLLALSHVRWTTGHVLPVRRAEGGDRPAGARRRRAVGRRDRRRRRRRSTSTPCRARSGSAGPTRRARSTCATPRRCASRGRATSRSSRYEPDGAFIAARRRARASTRAGSPSPSLAGLAAALGRSRRSGASSERARWRRAAASGSRERVES